RELGVAGRRAVAALGREVVDSLLTMRLVTRGGGNLVPRARIVPVEDVLLASDGFTRDADDPPDYVATYTPTARTCDLLTPRMRCDRALDIGTGSGIHALLAAEHAKHVVAVDVNERALAYTRLNAALNGLDNVECRTGSLFEPVAGESFDLITCNAPYVVSPEQRWTRYLGDLEARGVGEGAILLHRGAGRPRLRVDEIDEDTLEPAGDQIRRAFANRERLRGEELPDGRLSRAMPLRLEAEIGRK